MKTHLGEEKKRGEEISQSKQWSGIAVLCEYRIDYN